MNIIKLALEKYEGWSITDYNYDTLEWYNTETAKPTKEQLESEGSVLLVEFKLTQLRAERNRRIAETDWWALVDSTMNPEREAYRQALRDITNTYSSLEEVVWPAKPE